MKKIELISCLFIYLIASSCNKNDNIVKEYYPDGIIKTIIEVKDGKRNGLTKNFDEKGRLESTAELKNDKYEGWLINYNTESGKVTAKAFYKNDKQNGPATLYYVTGELYREITYVDGRVDSIVKTYWANGKPQAEVFFRKGDPSIGLKEFDKQGNPVQQTHIVIEKINQLETTSSVTLKIYLSDKSTKVDFYQGGLEEGKYLASGNIEIDDEKGVATLQYYVPKNRTLKKELSIIARTRTSYGNTLVLQKSYNLIVSN
jgi:hypothetical protein